MIFYFRPAIFLFKNSQSKGVRIACNYPCKSGFILLSYTSMAKTKTTERPKTTALRKTVNLLNKGVKKSNARL